MTKPRVHIDASESLHGYKAWRKSLVPVPIGTRVRWNVPYDGCTQSSSIKVGQCFMVVAFGDGVTRSNHVADKVYKMVLCNPKTGKLFKKDVRWSVEGIASRLETGDVTIVPREE